MTRSEADRVVARQALRQARADAGLSPSIDDEPTLRVIAAIISSHAERRASESPSCPPISTETNYAPPAKDQSEASAEDAKLENQAIPEDREPTGEMGR
jgi:hypothetical protein